MIRRTIVWVLLLSVMMSFTGAEQPYEQIFGPNYQGALKFIAKNKKLIETTFSNKSERALAISVAFPELIRYSMTQDMLETAALEIGYLQGGSKVVDYSIGPFQMKPSFFESLEKAIAADTAQYAKIWQAVMRYPNRPESDLRPIRLTRLKSLQWQLWYLKAFCQMASHRLACASKKPANQAECVRLIATAYNAGLHQPISQWPTLAQKRFFPYGAKYKGPQYAYSDVAAHFFTKHWGKG